MEQLEQTQILPMAKCTGKQENYRSNLRVKRWGNNPHVLFV